MKTKQPHMAIHLLVDESGSMELMASDDPERNGMRYDQGPGSCNNGQANVIKALNIFLDELRSLLLPPSMTIKKFMYHAKVMVDNKPVTEIPPITSGDYYPDGGTALHDCIVKECAALAERNAKMNVLMIITDGKERGGEAEVKRAMALAKANGWLVLFLGTGMDSLDKAKSIGIPPETSLDWHGAKMEASMRAAADAIIRYSDDGLAAASAFTAEQRVATK